MTSVLHYRDPMSYRSEPLHPAFVSPPMASLKRASTYEGASSGSESKKPEPATPGAKRRPSRAGTRSVSTLTAQQLERKRANDREAQRAIRQRHKDNVANLERQIQDLTAQLEANTSSRVLELMRRTEQLEEECNHLRGRLSQYEAVPMPVQQQTQASGITNQEPNGIMSTIAGAPSPSDRIHMLSQPRRSSTSTPRSMHSVPDLQTPVSQPPHWPPQPQMHGYPPNIASPHGQGSPHLSNVPPPPETVRWNQPSHHPAAMPVQDPSLQSMDQGGVPYSSGYPIDSNGRAMSYPLENQQIVTSQPMPMTSYSTPTSARSPHSVDYPRPMSLPLAGPTSAPHHQHQHQHPHPHSQPPPPQAPQTPYSSFSAPAQQTFVSPSNHPGEMQPMMSPHHHQPHMMGEQGPMMYHQH